MAQINVTTTEAERNAVLKVLVELRGEVAPVSHIAREAGLKQSRARYAILDLIEAGRIEKVPHRAFNKHYVRYSYNIL
jgi:DNA-binding MarR family transcriptional regulator